MILYFSATGNSKHVARKLATSTGDRVISIENLSPKVELAGDEVLGIVTPTYAWRIPAKVERFLEALTLSGSAPSYAFCVATYGTTPGASGPFLRKLLEQKIDCGVQLFSVRMPDTWTPMFDLSDKGRVEETNRAADVQVEKLCQSIAHREQSKCMPGQVPGFIIPIVNFYYESMRQTAKFTVEDSCIGCGLCAKRCPDSAIEMRDGRPAWTKPKCDKCLRCLHYCPKFAIQHGSKTKKHGQYHHS